MYNQKCILKVKTLVLSVCALLSLALTGCGPSEEKIAQAQDVYVQLTSLHNQVVEAHQQIDDSSLDQELVALAEKVKQIGDYNLSELKDEEIDQVIETMNSIADSYQEYLDTINTIISQEDAAELTAIPLTLYNNTEITFQVLELYSQDNSGMNTNILEDTSGFVPEQFLTGLVIYRDTDFTPWLLKLEDANETVYEIQLPVEEYDEDGISLTLTYDSEQKEIKCS